MVLKQWTNAVIGVIDKKLERFDPKWQAANGKGPVSPATGSGAV